MLLSSSVFAQNYWSIQPDGGIEWKVQGAHNDHIEMSGQLVSTVLRYGVNQEGAFYVDRSVVWPTLRTIPNDTHASLTSHFADDIVRHICINGEVLQGEKVDNIYLKGLMRVESHFDYQKLTLTRTLFPSVDKRSFCEQYQLTNQGEKKLSLLLPAYRKEYLTNPAKGVDKSYRIVAQICYDKTPSFTLKPGETVTFAMTFSASRADETIETPDVKQELTSRKNLLSEFGSKLQLVTPDSVLNVMFDFAKIRAAESIYKTKGGYLHGPGGEAYYAAVWANDQAEYVNPFFPYMGYAIGNRSAMDCYRLYMRYMNTEYKALPSSIIAEGLDIWAGVGDRGDAAMIAYGASRYALASGNRDEAQELWPLIQWCLEYCRRQLNQKGVVASDCDELENRFPSGDANLCTSSLYYDALLSASYLVKSLGIHTPESRQYLSQAQSLRKNIDSYFGKKVEGYDTYQYYEGNDVLRSWICIPLTMGIYDRKDETIRALFSDRLWTSNGLLTQAGTSTYWDRSTLYALRGVLACGETEKAIEFLGKYSRQRLLGAHVPYAIEAWPEGGQRHLSAESGLYCRIFTEGLFGIRPTGLNSFQLTPRLPKQWSSMSMKHVQCFGSDFDILVSRENGKIRVSVLTSDCKGKSKAKMVANYLVKEGKTMEIKL